MMAGSAQPWLPWLVSVSAALAVLALPLRADQDFAERRGGLESERERLAAELAEVESALKELDEEEAAARSAWGPVTLIVPSKLEQREGPTVVLEGGTRVEVLGLDEGDLFGKGPTACCLVRHEGQVAFISQFWLPDEVRESAQRALDAVKSRAKDLEHLQRVRERSKRRTELMGRFGAEVADRILNQSYWLGMSQEMALESLGLPDDINRTVAANLHQEQWVYGMDLFLYFDETGTLQSFQD